MTDSTAFSDELVALLGAEHVHADEPMSAHTTFKIGGPAQWLVTPQSVEDIKALQELCQRHEVRLRTIGLGSDLLISDAGLQGVILKLADNFAQVSVDDQTGCVTAQAGASNEQVAEAAQAHGLAGYEFASGIPGSIGGAAIMNAGAYDGEFKDVCTGCTCLTPQGDIVEVSVQQADWGYRHSMMSDEGYIVLSVVLQLRPDNKDDIQARMDDLRERRESKQPLEMPSAGSTFKRPEGYFAGKLIQDAGMQGQSVGGAQVSTKHAGFVVNTGDATAQDVCDLIAKVQENVYSKFQVKLEPEVRFWD